jgi:hypothetical protein
MERAIIAMNSPIVKMVLEVRRTATMNDVLLQL